MKKEENVMAYSIFAFVFLTLFSILINLLVFIIPFLVNKIINLEIVLSPFVVFLIVLAMLTQIALQLVLIVIQNRCMKKYKIKLCLHLYQKIFSMRYEQILHSGPTYLVQRADMAALTFSQMRIQDLPVLISKFMIIVIILFYALSINEVLFGIMLGMTVVNIVGFYVLNKNLSVKSAYMQRHIPKEREDIYQIASQVDFLKQNADNTAINPILDRHLEKIEQINMEVNTYANGGSNVISFFNMFLQNIVLIILTFLYLNGRSGMADVFTIAVLISYFIPAVMSIVGVNLNLRELRACKEFISFLEDNQEKNGTIAIDGIRTIEFEMEKMGLGNGTYLMENINMTAKRGDVIGIIGESGTGKSTLMKALLKYWESSGIKVNGIPLEQLDNEAYRYHISYYSQNPTIITGSIEDNLNFGKNTINDTFRKISFLKKFQDENQQWNREILENGNNLSGGDKQKISLARMLVDPAEVLILDEPTGSLDAETEEMVLGDLLKNCGDKIVFIITHRPSNLKYCNKIYKIENKELREVKF